MTGSMTGSEDLVQELSCARTNSLPRFGQNPNFSTWLCRIMVNGAVNGRAQESRREAFHTKPAADVMTEGLVDLVSGGTEELQGRVLSAVNQLPAKQRAAIMLTVSHASLALVQLSGFFLLLSLMEIRKSAFMEL